MDFTQDQGNNLIKFCIEYYDPNCFILMAAYLHIEQIGLLDIETFYIGDCFEYNEDTEGSLIATQAQQVASIGELCFYPVDK